MEQRPIINIVVVCWNALEYTKVTLKSLFETIDQNIYLTIIDNGSHKETEIFIHNMRKSHLVKGFSYIRNNNNLGIGAAYNQGFFQSLVVDCEYTIFCNNDLLFSKGWLSKMINFMNSHKDVALLNPLRPSSNDYFNQDGVTTMDRLINVNHSNPRKELKDFIGDFTSFDAFCNYVSEVNIKKYGFFREIHFPDSLSSCICMSRMSILKKYNYFANNCFKRYGSEDIDLCWTVLDDGYKCVVLNNTYIHHYRHKSVEENKLDYNASLKLTNTQLYSKWKEKIINYLNKRKKDSEIPNSNWILDKILENKYEE